MLTVFFFFNDTATTEIYTLSLHDALPISLRRGHPVMIPKVPTVFGHEFAGTVTAAGAGVPGFREGDRVVAANSAPCGACRSCLAGRPNLCEDLLFVNGAYGESIAPPRRLGASNGGLLGRAL